MTAKDEKLIFVAEPILSSTYDLLPMTLRFDRGLKDDFFTVKAKTGDAVSDEVRKARYEFGQYMVRPVTLIKRPTDREIKAELERMLQDSSMMANELKASSVLRDGRGMSSYWPWLVAVPAVSAACLLYYRQRRA